MNHILFIPEKLVLRDSAQSFPQAVCAPKVFFKRMTNAMPNYGFLLSTILFVLVACNKMPLMHQVTRCIMSITHRPFSAEMKKATD